MCEKRPTRVWKETYMCEKRSTCVKRDLQMWKEAYTCVKRTLLAPFLAFCVISRVYKDTYIYINTYMYTDIYIHARVCRHTHERKVRHGRRRHTKDPVSTQKRPCNIQKSPMNIHKRDLWKYTKNPQQRLACVWKDIYLCLFSHFDMHMCADTHTNARYVMVDTGTQGHPINTQKRPCNIQKRHMNIHKRDVWTYEREVHHGGHRHARTPCQHTKEFVCWHTLSWMCMCVAHPILNVTRWHSQVSFVYLFSFVCVIAHSILNLFVAIQRSCVWFVCVIAHSILSAHIHILECTHTHSWMHTYTFLNAHIHPRWHSTRTPVSLCDECYL